jgi:glutathione S-transferase
MSKDIVFYTNPYSRGGIVHWMLEEVGCDYRAEVLEFGPPMKSAAYLAINPMGKVPAITHGDIVVTEAAAICAYLADAFPEAGLAPGPESRGEYYRWLFFAAGCLEPAISNRSAGWNPVPGMQPRFGYGSYEATLDTLANGVAGKTYIAGDRFSAADVYVGSILGWGMQFGGIEKRPEFEAYWNGLRDRPAALRADAQSEEMKALTTWAAE